MTEREIERWNALNKKTGKSIPAPVYSARPDWSLFDEFRDKPVSERPKTYNIGGGTGRRR